MAFFIYFSLSASKNTGFAFSGADELHGDPFGFILDSRSFFSLFSPIPLLFAIDLFFFLW